MADETTINPNAGGVPPGPGAGAPGVDPTAAPKRGRGRPKKPLGLSQPPAGGAGPAAPGNEPPGNFATPLWSAENCRPIGQLPFLVAGVATGWEGWALDDREAGALAEPLAAVLNALIPAGGKYAAIVALSSTALVIGGMKYKGYREYLAAEAAKAKKENAGADK